MTATYHHVRPVNSGHEYDRAEPWQWSAACHRRNGGDPKLWDEQLDTDTGSHEGKLSRERRHAQAIEICITRCTVFAQCRENALTDPQITGVAGGEVIATKPRQLDPDDPRHGTPLGYKQYKCRCDRCCKAYAERRLSRAKTPSAAELRAHHAAYVRGLRDDETVLGEKEYHRRRNLKRDQGAKKGTTQ